jgi:hypothetical protein
MGRRAGSPGLPFSTIAHIFAGSQLVRVSSASVIGGIMAHVIVAMAWGLVFALLVERWRGRVVGAALVVALAGLVLSWLLARVAGRGLATLLPIGDRLILALVFAIALVVGMRFALPAHETI